MSHLRTRRSIQERYPNDPLSAVLQICAYQCFLRRGKVPNIVNTLLALAINEDQKKSGTLLNRKNSRPGTIKYSPDQPRVPAGNPDGGQWTSVDGDEWPHSPNGRQNENIRVAADLSGFTKHGLNQAINQEVSPSAILDALNNPIKIIPKSNGTTRYIGRHAVVVLNPAGNVITVWGQ